MAIPTWVVELHMHWAIQRSCALVFIRTVCTYSRLLTVVTVVGQVTLADLLSVVLGRLVHPALRGVGERVLVRSGAGHAPEEVLALVGTLRAGRVLHVADVVRQVVCPRLGVADEVIIPLEGLQAFSFAAVVLDVEAFLLVGSHGEGGGLDLPSVIIGDYGSWY